MPVVSFNPRSAPRKALVRAEPTLHSAAPVYERIRDMIVSLAIEPGSLVNRAALQTRFGLSSTPVRDALMRLTNEGLVEVFPQSATRVSLIDVEKARQSQFLRRAIETEAVKIVSDGPDRTVVNALKELIELQTAAAERSDVAAFQRADQQFHALIYEAAGAPDLFDLLRRHNGHIDRIRRLNLPVAGKMQEVIREHAAITRAIAAGATGDAMTRMRDHLSRSLAYSPTLRRKYPNYFKS